MTRPLPTIQAVLGVSFFLSSACAQNAKVAGSENIQPAVRSGFRLSATPESSIDLRVGIPGNAINVVGAARVKDGIVLVEGTGSRVVFYSRDLKVARILDLKSPTRGRLNVFGLQRVNGDTLAILEYGQGWIVAPTDTVDSLLTFAGINEPRSGSISMLLGVFPDRSSLWGVLDLGMQRRPPAKKFTDSLELVLQSSNGDLRKIRRIPALTVGTDSAGRSRQMWFYPHLAHATLQNHFYYGFGSEYRITRLNPFTSEEQSWTRAWQPRQVTSADIEEFIHGWSINWNRGPDSAAVKAAMRKAPFADFVPAFSQFLISSTDELWVRTPSLIDAQGSGELHTVPFRASVWNIFNKDGRWLTDVTLPAGFQPTDIGSDYVLGVQYGMKDGAPRGRERKLVLYKYSRSP